MSFTFNAPEKKDETAPSIAGQRTKQDNPLSISGSFGDAYLPTSSSTTSSAPALSSSTFFTGAPRATSQARNNKSNESGPKASKR